MSLPNIAIINFSSALSDQDVQDAIRVVNRQVVEDFMPIWGGGRTLKLHATVFDPADEDTLKEEEIRAESVIYLIDQGNIPMALGYHSLNSSELPFGFVFTEFINEWTVTLSHEVLELIIDPTANIFVPGPDPRDPTNPDKFVLHTYEVCDAVERTSYRIDGIRVSNFITPAWFAAGDAAGTRNDFLGVDVPSFQATTGSHLAFFDLLENEFIPDFIGTSSPSNTMLARRMTQYEFNKPQRDERQLEAALIEGKRKHQNLSRMQGVSRTARYFNNAQHLTSAS